MKTLICKLTNLDWLRGTEAERHSSANYEEHSEEANRRGEKMLSEILSAFPKLKKTHSIPQVTYSHPVQGGFEGRVALDFYRAGESTINVVKHNSILNEYYAERITDFDLLINCLTQGECETHRKGIAEISESYKVSDTLGEMHKVKFRIF